VSSLQLINLLTNAIKVSVGHYCTFPSWTLTMLGFSQFIPKTATTRRIHFALDATQYRPRRPDLRSGDDFTVDDGHDTQSQPQKCFLIFSVQDTGVGIVESERARLFERFKQGNVRTHVTYGGNGLVRCADVATSHGFSAHMHVPLQGLYICKQIINLLGGELDFISIIGRIESDTNVLSLARRHLGRIGAQ
jgi:signal transduction histidine kinase